jgi:hypothetical protein
VNSSESPDDSPTRTPSFDDIAGRVRELCLAHPEVHEEQAWVGLRWCVGTKTFAHVLDIVDGHPPAYATAADTDGPTSVLMFRSGGDELEALRHTGAPFFATSWRSDEIGLMLGHETDWDEVAELLTESYLLRAPQRLRGDGQ